MFRGNLYPELASASSQLRSLASQLEMHSNGLHAVDVLLRSLQLPRVIEPGALTRAGRASHSRGAHGAAYQVRATQRQETIDMRVVIRLEILQRRALAFLPGGRLR